LNTQENSEKGLFLPFRHLVSGVVQAAGGGAMSAWEAEWMGGYRRGRSWRQRQGRASMIPFVDEGGNFCVVVGISEFKIFGFWEEQYGEGAGGFFLPLNFI
jgi:hypothetical protein